MAISDVIVIGRKGMGNGMEIIHASFLGDASYPSGGYPKEQVEATLNKSIVNAMPAARPPYVINITAGKLVVRDLTHSGLPEVAAGTDLSQTTFEVALMCK